MINKVTGARTILTSMVHGLLEERPIGSASEPRIEVVPIMWKATWRSFEAQGITRGDALEALTKRLHEAVSTELLFTEAFATNSGFQRQADAPGLILRPSEALEYLAWKRGKNGKQRA